MPQRDVYATVVTDSQHVDYNVIESVNAVRPPASQCCRLNAAVMKGGREAADAALACEA